MDNDNNEKNDSADDNSGEDSDQESVNKELDAQVDQEMMQDNSVVSGGITESEDMELDTLQSRKRKFEELPDLFSQDLGFHATHLVGKYEFCDS